MELVAISDVIKKGRIVPIEFYKSDCRRIRVALAFGYYKAVLPSKKPEYIKIAQDLCSKFRASPLGIKPFGVDYMYYKGEKKNVIIGLTNKLGSLYFSFKDNASYDRFINKEAREYFSQRVELWKKVMNIDHEFKIRVSDAIGNMGSNSRRTSTLSFNRQLLSFSPHIVDAIIVHELAHYFQANHSDKFYKIVYQNLPDYDKLEMYIREGNFNGEMQWLKKLHQNLTNFTNILKN